MYEVNLHRGFNSSMTIKADDKKGKLEPDRSLLSLSLSTTRIGETNEPLHFFPQLS